jgi:hypothetical protein
MMGNAERMEESSARLKLVITEPAIDRLREEYMEKASVEL